MQPPAAIPERAPLAAQLRLLDTLATADARELESHRHLRTTAALGSSNGAADR